MSDSTPVVPTPQPDKTGDQTPVTPPTIDAQVVGYTPAPDGQYADQTPAADDPRQRYEQSGAYGQSGVYSQSGVYGQSGAYGQSAPYTSGGTSTPYPGGQPGPQAASGNWGAYSSPAGQPGAAPYQGMVTPKSKIVAGILGVVLGTFGIHNFYLGYIGKGLAQLGLTVLTFGLLSFISAIWGLLEGVLILISQPGTPWHRDAQGNELTD